MSYYKLSPLPYLQIKKLKKKKKKNKASMLHYTCVVLALGFSVEQLARPNLFVLRCAVLFVPTTHRGWCKRGFNVIISSIISSPCFFLHHFRAFFLLFCLPYSILLKISLHFPLYPNKIPKISPPISFSRHLPQLGCSTFLR